MGLKLLWFQHNLVPENQGKTAGWVLYLGATYTRVNTTHTELPFLQSRRVFSYPDTSFAARSV